MSEFSGKVKKDWQTIYACVIFGASKERFWSVKPQNYEPVGEYFKRYVTVEQL